MVKKHLVGKTSFSESIGMLCRLVLFAEDVVEDSQCEDLFIDDKGSNGYVLKPINCSYDVHDSVSVFRERYGIENIRFGEASKSYKTLYDQIIEIYERSFHPKMKRILRKTLESRLEYFAGVTFDGHLFVLEGEVDSVRIPAFPHCLSVHTHPSLHPIPSREDFKGIVRLITDRGVGHTIVANLSSLAIYRVKPVTVEEYKQLREWLTLDPLELIEFIRTKPMFLRLKSLP